MATEYSFKPKTNQELLDWLDRVKDDLTLSKLPKRAVLILEEA